MTDSRFTTPFESSEELLNIVDIDDLDDLETMLMFLFDRPISVAEVWEEQGGALEVGVLTDDGGIGTIHEYPFSVLDVVSACGDLVDELGPYTGEGSSGREPPVTDMTEPELLAAMQSALGKVRIFNILHEDADDDA